MLKRGDAAAAAAAAACGSQSACGPRPPASLGHILVFAGGHATLSARGKRDFTTF